MKNLFKIKKILGIMFALGLMFVGFICMKAETGIKEEANKEDFLEERNEIKLKNTKEYNFNYTPTHEDSIIFVYDLTIGDNLEVTLPIIVDTGYVVYWAINHWPAFYVSYNSSFPKHTYGAKGIFFVEVVGNIEKINSELFFRESGVHPSSDQLVACLRFNKNLKSLSDAFYKCKNLVKIPDEIPSQVRKIDWMLTHCQSFDQPINWNFRKVEAFTNLFGYTCGISSENYNITIKNIANSKKYEPSQTPIKQRMNNPLIRYVYNKSNFDLLMNKGFDFVDGGYQTAEISVNISYLTSGYKYHPIVTGITYDPDVQEIKNKLKYKIEKDSSDDMAIITPYLDSISNKYYVNFTNKKAKRIIDLRPTRWQEQNEFAYDGNNHTYSIWNLPAMWDVNMQNSVKSATGKYTAKVTFNNDRYHFINDNLPRSSNFWIREHLNLSGLRWQSKNVLDYNGGVRGMYLENLPTSINPNYKNNEKVAPGKYTASFNLTWDYDRVKIVAGGNLDGISKTNVWWIVEVIDIKDYKWQEQDYFDWDGNYKKMDVINSHAKVVPSISNNWHKDPGTYTAVISKFIYDNDKVRIINNNIPSSKEFKIIKSLSTRNLKWTYYDSAYPAKYTGGHIENRITGLPVEIEIQYGPGTKMVNVGYYVAGADLKCDERKYKIIGNKSVTKNWYIYEEINLQNAKITGTYHDWDGSEKKLGITNIDSRVIQVPVNCAYKDPGTYIGEIHLTVSDEILYRVINKSHLLGKKTWKIIRTFDFRSAKWTTSKHYWDGTLKTVHLENRPLGHELINTNYIQNTGTNPNVYEAKVNFAWDTSKYNVLYNNTLVNNKHIWKIVKKLDLKPVSWETDTFYFDNKVKEMKTKNLPSEIKINLVSGSHNFKQTTPGHYLSTFTFSYDTRIYELINENSFKKSINWKIKKKLYFNDAKWINTSIKWNGNMQSVDIVGLPSEIGKNFTINSTYSQSQKNQGEYKAQVSLINPDPSIYEEYGKTLPTTMNWKIWKELDLRHMNWSNDKFYWDGNVKKIYLTNYFTETQFKINIKENEKTKEGEYEATATLEYNPNIYDIKNNNFAKTKKWIIIKKLNFNASKWTTDTFEYDGSQKEIILDGIPNELKSFSSYTNNYSTLEGIFKAKVTINGYNTKIYEVSGLNLIQEKTWSIKRTLNFGKVNWNETLFTYDGNYKEVKLENLPTDLNPSFGIKVIYTSEKHKDAGRYQATADLVYNASIYTLTFNHFLRTNDWKIVQDIDVTNVKWSSNQLAWDGNNKTISLVGLNPLINVKYTGNIQKNPGIYTATVTLDYKKDIYNLIGLSFADEIEWRIIKTLDLSKVKWTAKELEYNGVSQTIKLENLPSDIKVTYTDNRMKELGIYTATATYNINESYYNLINKNFTNEFEWVIYKKINLLGVDWNFKKFIWDGNQKEVKLVGLPYEITAETQYEKNVEKNPGKYKSKVKFLYNSRIYKIENKNFNDEVEWKIVKTIDFSNVRWSPKEQYYDGFTKEMILLNLHEDIKISYNGNYLESEPGKYEAEYNLLNDLDIYEIINNNVDKKISWNVIREISLANVYWNENLFNYNGSVHQVYLVNLPVEVEYKYTNDKQIYAGEYKTSLTLSVDEDKYKIVDDIHIKPLDWKIVKILDLVDVDWNQNEFKWDGTNKKVELVGVPSEIKTTYTNNIKSDSGRYRATVEITYDSKIYGVINDNFDDFVVWFILEEIDLRDLKWSNNRFIQDGREHQVYLEGLIDSRIKVSYKGEKASDFGKYNAIAEFKYDSDKIKIVNEPDLNLTWFIAKKLDFKDVSWCHNMFEYDGEEKRVFLKNLPDEEIKVIYKGHKGIAPGKYQTVVEVLYDNDLYIGNEDFGIFEWEIIDVKVLKGSNLWAYIMTGLSTTILIEFLVITKIKKNKIEEELGN